MAEVLITLGILGVVIAMTLPSLISKHNEKVWLTRFKKVYTTLYQAYNRVYIDYGPAKDWGIDGSKESIERAYKMLSKYLNVGVEYGFERPNNHVVYKDLFNKNLGDRYAPVFFTTKTYNFTLSDGSLFGLVYDGEIPGLLMQVDINGDKGPNQLGKDFFYLSLISRNNAPFVAGFAKWWNAWPDSCSLTKPATGWYSGGSCSSWVIATGNMDYLHREITLEEWNRTVILLLVEHNEEELD